MARTVPEFFHLLPLDENGVRSCNDGNMTTPASAGAHPVITLSFPRRIACATATLFGRYGAVTRLAQEYGLCRQSVYRQADAVRADLEAQAHHQEVLRLRQQLEQVQAQCADGQRRLQDAVALDQERQAE